MSLILGTAILVLALWLAYGLWRASVGRSQHRARYFAKTTPLFDRVVTRTEPTGFARMTGHLGRDAFDLQALPDSLTFRKLPSLWVMLTLPQPLPVAATLDIMVRPTGQECFSHYPSLPQSLPCPAFLPGGTGIRSDDAAGVAPLDLVSRHAAIFADPRVKELVISAKGLRIVIQGDQADRSRYLLFRDAELGLAPLPAARAEPLIKTLLALKADILAQAKDHSR